MQNEENNPSENVASASTDVTDSAVYEDNWAHLSKDKRKEHFNSLCF
jgi:hypothetical protein